MAKKKPKEEPHGEVPEKTRRGRDDGGKRKTVGASSSPAFYQAKVTAKGRGRKRVLAEAGSRGPRASAEGRGFAGRCVLNPEGAALAGPHRRS